MLSYLQIKHFALIPELEIEFMPGITVLTGETGAGKSIIVDAVNLLAGERATADVIRTGEEAASVTGIFEIDKQSSVGRRLQQAGIPSEDETVVLRREISRAAKSRCFINNTPVALSLLKDIGDDLVDIHGQHDHQSLLSARNHVRILDGFGQLQNLLGRYQEVYEQHRATTESLSGLALDESEKEKMKELYSFQITEIDNAKLNAQEEEALLQEKTVLSNAGVLYSLALKAYGGLYEDEESVLTKLGKVQNAVLELAGIDKSFSGTVENLESLIIQINETSYKLREYRDMIHFDEARLLDVEDRLALISGLKRKYGGSIEEILRYRETIAGKLKTILGNDEEVASLKQKLEVLCGQMKSTSDDLSRKRHLAAKKLGLSVQKELVDLGMPGAIFVVNLRHLEEFNQNGADEVEFLFSSNPGEEPMPLGKIASGGELSRVMLALKVTAAESDRIPVLIFDEVDTNVGGRLADVIARKLKEVSAHHQVIFITHLPQIAATANNHLHVSKKCVDGKTVTAIKRLEGEERIAEIAAMLAGKAVSQTATKHAKELLQRSGHHEVEE
jgi:DNA repair protein RecN (Recombination protein N)